MIIRPATIDDAEAIAHVHVEAWRTAYRRIVPEEYLDRLSKEDRKNRWVTSLGDRSSKGFTFVAESDGEIVAFAGAGPERKNDPDYAGELYAIYLLDTFQRQGIGTALLRTVMTRLAELGMQSMKVWVLRDNPARAFYERHGGVLVGEDTIRIADREMSEVAYGWKQLVLLGAD
jgi:GNAT superfamily N-acetyltransferase